MIEAKYESIFHDIAETEELFIEASMAKVEYKNKEGLAISFDFKTDENKYKFIVDGVYETNKICDEFIADFIESMSHLSQMNAEANEFQRLFSHYRLILPEELYLPSPNKGALH